MRPPRTAIGAAGGKSIRPNAEIARHNESPWMGELNNELAVASYGTKTAAVTSGEIPTRRVVLAGAMTVGATLLTGALSAVARENTMNKTFTILHTNDMHSAFIAWVHPRTTRHSHSTTMRPEPGTRVSHP